ncbi:MAG: hypothetical protein KIT72_16240 [Polyangiaceae bacterium]|nr:hypothetical protein [Polyangiaceae bacterium]MCW5791968.1 hypothetical protein [Polyangiaceae bacterium]
MRWLSIGLLSALVGCEIVQSAIPIDLEEEPSSARDAGPPPHRPYPGAPCGEARATLCVLGDEAPSDAGSGDADQLDDAGSGDASDWGDAEAGAEPSEGRGDAGGDGSDVGGEEEAEWCALSCTLSCDDGRYTCHGPVRCGRGTAGRPPSCGALP